MPLTKQEIKDLLSRKAWELVNGGEVESYDQLIEMLNKEKIGDPWDMLKPERTALQAAIKISNEQKE